MDRYEYYDIIGEVIEKAKFPKSEIFDYIDSPSEETYEAFFQFCQKNLSENCEEYKIQPAKFFYRENLGVNAGALLSNGYYLILINKGLIHQFQEFYYENKILDLYPKFEPYRQIFAEIDTTLEHLAYQTATLFTFYHELGHLIQKSSDLPLLLDEQYFDTGTTFSLIKHIHELDSDLHGANNICFHVIAYWDDLKKSQNKQIFEGLLILSLSSIFSYFMFLLEMNHRALYYEENTHPHPLIRITYISTVFLDVAKKYYSDIDQKAILNEALEMSGLIFEKHFGKDVVSTYKDELFNNYDAIMTYMEKLIEEAKKIPYLAINTVHKNNS